MRAHALRVAGKLGEVADDEMLDACSAEESAHLRIERGQIERDENVRLAIGDFVFEHLFRV